MSEKLENKSLNSKLAAEYLGISECSIRNSRTTGLLGGRKAPKFRKIGRKVIYLEADLEAWRENLPVFENTTQMKFEQQA
ncbi:helix-turn-helix domain-containing protein [Thiomicrorhabdus sp.]|uniref:helix-turn-helix domain-containing protein n=1 Tax=Thiomicrorhabdus sp. TaxID=2039724 RepID=UPI0029C61DCC|nr:helix-turn-helix domain-containing protein [Thiomicrorhabdus sp.]